MARGKIKRHPVEPDGKYNDTDIAKLINQIMKKGKKTIAQKIVYGAFDIIKEKTQKEPVEVFKIALENAAPMVEVKAKRVGGANYQVPTEVRGERRLALALRWMLGAARNRKGKPMAEKLAQEIMDAAKNEGTAIKKKNDVHRMAEANRAFAHFAW